MGCINTVLLLAGVGVVIATQIGETTPLCRIFSEILVYVYF